jgi:ABC-type polysaccharide/polyol phosphate export permease
MGWILAKRDMTNRYANSFFGTSWNVGVPLIYASVNAIVFSILMGNRLGVHELKVPYVLYYFIPFSLWVYFSDVVNRSTGIFREYKHLITKISFPFWVVPLIPIVSAFLNQFILFTIILFLFFFFKIPLSISCFTFFFLWILNLLLTIGCSYLVSSISVYIPDFSQIIPLGLNILFWITPILYPIELVQKNGHILVQTIIISLNPFSHMAILSRESLLGDLSLHGSSILFFTTFSIIMFTLGILFFKKLKSGFADVI